MTLHIRDTAPNFEAETTEGPVRCHDWIDYRGLTPDQRKRLMQHVIRDVRAARSLGDTGLCALQAAAGGGTAVMRALAKAVTAAAGKWWRSYALRRARIAAIRDLHALGRRAPSDIGVGRSEIEWLVGPRPRSAAVPLGLTVVPTATTRSAWSLPVMLPPGRLRLETSPAATGSTDTPKTIGIVAVAA